jgi:DNA-binding beta-propeller fold protein YncE
MPIRSFAPGAAKSALRLAAPLLLVLCTLELSGCSAPAQSLLTPARELAPQWPEAPFTPRIKWVKSVATPEDAGIRKSLWKKALEFVTGADVRQLVKPYGVLYDDQGRLIIADPGAGIVHLMDTKKQQYLRITAGEGAPFRSPIGITEDDRQQLYITDSAADTVYRYDLVQQRLTPFLRGLERPTGIAFNKVNRLLYVSESTARRVTAVDLEGNTRLTFGDRPGPEQYPFNVPTDVATDFKGQIFVTDPLNYKIKTYTPEGTQVNQFGEMGDTRGEFDKPKGVAVDPEGRIYVVDALLDAVQIFDDEGAFLFSFGATGSDDGAFWMPSGICLHNGYIFVADTFNQRVQIFQYLTGREGDESRRTYPGVLTTKR